MPVLTFASVKGSPGATTAALLTAACWPSERVLIEADGSGGVLAARLGLSQTPSALELAGAARTGLDRAVLRSHCQPACEGVPLLVGPAEPLQVAATFRELASPLLDFLNNEEITGIVDAGRLHPSSPAWPLVAGSVVIVLVARCRLEEFVPLSARARELRAAGARVGVVLIADGPYPPEEFAGKADVELLGGLPLDERAAITLRGEASTTRRLSRSPLWHAAGELTAQLHGLVVADPPTSSVSRVRLGDRVG